MTLSDIVASLGAVVRHTFAAFPTAGIVAPSYVAVRAAAAGLTR